MNKSEKQPKKDSSRPLSHALWEFLNDLLHTSDEMRIEFRNRTAAYLTAAFGLVAGLAWNDAIKSLIVYWFPSEAYTVTAKFFYAIGITVIFVIVSILVISVIKIENDKKEKKLSEEKDIKKAAKAEKSASDEKEPEKTE